MRGVGTTLDCQLIDREPYNADNPERPILLLHKGNGVTGGQMGI